MENKKVFTIIPVPNADNNSLYISFLDLQSTSRLNISGDKAVGLTGFKLQRDERINTFRKYFKKKNWQKQ